MTSYQNDPRWITVKYETHCRDCGLHLPRGTKAYYFPLSKDLYCRVCGTMKEKKFVAEAQDESFLKGSET